MIIEDRQIEEYLSEYSVFRKMIEVDIYNMNYFGKPKISIENISSDGTLPGGRPVAAARMFEIRRFVLSLPSCDEKVFLFYHYIHGETTERCAELMHIARRSAFRLKPRALEFAAPRLKRYLEANKVNIK